MSGKKIKVALCLSGEPRSSMFCYPYIYESFINLGPNYEVDIYIHSRKNFRALFLYNPKTFYKDSSIENLFPKYFDPINLPPELKESTEFLSHFTLQSNFLNNSILMLDGILKCFNMASSKDKNYYDIYIRCRPDIITDHTLPIKIIIEDILLNKYDLFIPQKNFSKLDIDYKTSVFQYNDQIAIGNSKSMNIYSNTVNNLNRLIPETKEWKSESWLYSQLKINNIKTNSFYLPISLVRGVQIYSNKAFEDTDLNFLDQ